MTILNKRNTMLGLACLMMSQSVNAVITTRDYTLNRDGEEYLWGTAKKESYDIAIRLSDPGLEGFKITRMQVMLPDDFSPQTPTGWLTTELALNEAGDNVADLITVDASIEGNLLTVDFPEVEIPGEGIYVGYSFGISSLTEAAKYPIAVGIGDDPNGFYFHSSRTSLKWKNESHHSGVVSSMKVFIKGDFRDFSIGIDGIQDCYILPGEEGVMEVGLVNHGLKTPSTIAYTVNFPDGSAYKSSFVPPVALEPQLETIYKVGLPLPAGDFTGTERATLHITEVENVANPDVAAEAEGYVTVMAFQPQRNVLMEEYTGLWCGACPRGYVALEEMRERGVKNFVGVSYHNSDHMSVFLPSEYPNYVEGFPSAFLNRADKVDAYYGNTGDIPMGIQQTVEEFAKQFTTGEVEVEISDFDAENLIIKGSSKSRFVFDKENARLALAFLLLADGLYNEAWVQSSYYTKEPSLVEESKFWEPFVNSGHVTGLVFNDIVVAATDLLGTEGSLPAEIASNHEYTNGCEFHIRDITNIYGKEFINGDASFRIVAIIIDKETGDILNCASSKAIGCAVEKTWDSQGETRNAYYDMSGRLIDRPGAGLYLRKSISSDGSTTVRKILKTK